MVFQLTLSFAYVCESFLLSLFHRWGGKVWPKLDGKHLCFPCSCFAKQMHRYRIHQQQWGQDNILGKKSVPLSDRPDWCLSCCRMLLPLGAHTLRFWQIYWFLSLMIWEDMNSNYFVLIDAHLLYMTKSFPKFFIAQVWEFHLKYVSIYLSFSFLTFVMDGDFP